MKTVHWLTHLTHSLHFLFHFFCDQVSVLQVKTREEISWVKLIPMWVSPQQPFLNFLLNLNSLTLQRRRKNVEMYFVYIFQAYHLNCIIFLFNSNHYLYQIHECKSRERGRTTPLILKRSVKVNTVRPVLSRVTI